MNSRDTLFDNLQYQHNNISQKIPGKESFSVSFNTVQDNIINIKEQTVMNFVSKTRVCVSN